MYLSPLLLDGQPSINLPNSQPVIWVDAHHILNEVLSIEANISRKVKSMFADVHHRLSYLLSLIIPLPNYHFVEDSTKRPNIRLLAILVLNQNFRSHVGWRTHNVGQIGREFLVRKAAKPEIANYRHATVLVQ